MTIKKSINDEELVNEFRKNEKLQPYKIKQLYYEIYNNSIINFDQMSTISKELRNKLKNEFYIIPFEIIKTIETQDTTKFVLKTFDNKIIETVLMFHYHDKGNIIKLNRITQCLSTQIGCPIGCKFCVTGKIGFERNLTTDEIIGQILLGNNYILNKFGKKDDGTLRKVRNIVFMGMGEPLLNYENLMKSIEIILNQNRFSLSKRHITISTVGLINGIKKLIDDNCQVRLAISLHTADQKTRDLLIPISKKNNLNELKKTLDEYNNKIGIKIFYEYIMIKNITDSIQMAQNLVNYIRNQNAHINLIAYNENPNNEYEESDEKTIIKFKEFLEKNNITVTIRGSLGRDSKGACGQLGYEHLKIIE